MKKTKTIQTESMDKSQLYLGKVVLYVVIVVLNKGWSQSNWLTCSFLCYSPYCGAVPYDKNVRVFLRWNRKKYLNQDRGQKRMPPSMLG
jgi:hypothetical protein